MNVLAQLTDAFLGRAFDAATLERAHEVVARGAVRRPEIGMLSAAAVTATVPSVAMATKAPGRCVGCSGTRNLKRVAGCASRHRRHP